LAAKTRTSKAKSKGKARKTRGTKGVDLRLVKALAHELRVEILTILNERMASPNELAKELGEGLSQVSYHVKVLKDYETITLVKTEPRRGAVEHYYRATSRPFVSDRDWQQLPGSVRSSLSAELLELIQGDAIHALVEGTFDARADAHLTRNLALIDEKGWRDLMKGLGATQSLISKVQTESAVRLQKSGEEGIPVSVAVLGFELPEQPSQRGAKKAKGKGKAKGKAKAKAKAKRK
jgi:DNA-binding transcriptional ArsR family regulator